MINGWVAQKTRATGLLFHSLTFEIPNGNVYSTNKNNLSHAFRDTTINH